MRERRSQGFRAELLEGWNSRERRPGRQRAGEYRSSYRLCYGVDIQAECLSRQVYIQAGVLKGGPG